MNLLKRYLEEKKKYQEELKGDQHKLDVDGDGKIEAEDLAKLRAKKKVKEEGYVSLAQQRAVWATRKDGGKGHPDNKKKSVKEEAVVEAADKEHPIVKEYDSLKKNHDIKSLRSLIKTQHKIIDTSEFKTKDHAISHYLRAKHGNKKVADAFGLKEEIDQIEEMTQGKEYTQDQLKKKIQSGQWEATHDIKPGKHVEMRHHTGKKVQVYVKEELEESASRHRVGVTVSEPDHPSVSMRKATKQKFVKVTAGSKEEAVKKAHAYYKKAGYKVHGAEYHSELKEDAEHIDELSDTTIKSYTKGAMRDTIMGKKDRNAGMKRAYSRIAGTNKPILSKEETELEEAKMKGEDPCWDSHEMIGHKMKNGKKVPNCVPKNEEKDDTEKPTADYKTTKDGKKYRAHKIVFKHGEDDGKMTLGEKEMQEKRTKKFSEFVSKYGKSECSKEEVQEGWEDMVKAGEARRANQSKSTTKTNHDVKKISTGTVYTKQHDKDGMSKGTGAPAGEQKRGRGRPRKDKFAEAVELLMSFDEELFEQVMEEGFDSFFDNYLEEMKSVKDIQAAAEKRAGSIMKPKTKQTSSTKKSLRDIMAAAEKRKMNEDK